jgi:hypothetical protein
LAPDVWPCSPNLSIGVLRLAHQGFVTGARTGIRLSLLPCCVCQSPKALVFAAMRSCLAETKSFADPVIAANPAFALSTTQLGQIPDLSGVTASRSSQTRLLAFGRSLLHSVSR